MSTVRQAIDDIQVIVNRLSPILKLQKKLEEIGDLDQLALETNNRKEKSANELASVLVQLSDKKAELDIAISVVDSAYKKFQSVEDSCRISAQVSRDNAKAEAAEIKKDAEDFKSSVQSEIRKAQIELSNLKLEIESHEETHEKIKKEIETSKQKFNALFGK